MTDDKGSPVSEARQEKIDEKDESERPIDPPTTKAKLVPPKADDDDDLMPRPPPVEDPDPNAAFVEPPPIVKEEPRVKLLTPFEDTTAYTLSKLPPLLRKYALVGPTAIEEATKRPIRWAWDGIAANNSHVEISGPTYSGKTTLVFLIAVASLAEKPVAVLGHKVFPVGRKQFVVLIEEENAEQSCAQKAKDTCEILGLPLSTTARLVTLPRLGFRPDSDVDHEIRSLADQGLVGRMFLDSRARIFPGNANSEEDQADAARWTLGMINRSKGSVWIVSHTRKGRGRELDDISGSQQRAATADSVIMLSSHHGESSRILSSNVVFKKVRDAPDGNHPNPVKFMIEKGPSGRWRCSHTKAKPMDIEVANAVPLQDRIVEILENTDNKPLSEHSLRAMLHTSPQLLKTAISNLLAEGTIVYEKQARPGRKVPGQETTKVYRLRQSNDLEDELASSSLPATSRLVAEDSEAQDPEDDDDSDDENT